MDETALIVNWVLWGALGLNLGVTIVLPRARLSRIPIHRIRWISAGLLVLQSAQLVNLYNDRLHLHARWAPLLFIACGPRFATAIVMEGIKRHHQVRPDIEDLSARAH